MITSKARRLRSLERQLRLGHALELPLILEEFYEHKDETPCEVIAIKGNTIWEKKKEESVNEFKERVYRDVKDCSVSQNFRS